MSQPATFWQKYGTLAQMAQATVALLGFVAGVDEDRQRYTTRLQARKDLRPQ